MSKKIVKKRGISRSQSAPLLIQSSKAVFNKFKSLRIALVYAKGVTNRKKLQESRHLVEEMQKITRLTFNADSPKTHHLIDPWVAAQKEFGKKAKHYHTSVEKLLKATLNNKKITSSNTLTNILTYMSLKHLIPLGVDDAAKLVGKVTFSCAKGSEKIDFLRTLKKGALYYKDEKRVLGTKLDYWKSKSTQITVTSKSALIHVHALRPVSTAQLKEIIVELTGLIDSFCNGSTQVALLTPQRPKVTFS